ncbi:MAG: serine/threonine-protein kinase [Verrucomicrobiota bacterium]
MDADKNFKSSMPPGDPDLSGKTSTGAPPARVPDHELLRCIGRGSYGEVWLARSITGAIRAVKIVARKSFDRDRPFDREFAGIQHFEPLSRSHAGLVSILHVGRNEAAGYFYYVMEAADNVRQTGNSSNALNASGLDPDIYEPHTLRHDLRRGEPLPCSRVVQIGLALSDALQFLHEHGLVHRDIKPSNIIFVRGQPKLADIGLVTGIGEKATFVGTEGYIPPEGPGTAGADLFALGKLVYEMTFGLDAEQFPKLPDQLTSLADPGQRMQINEVILAACDPDPERRFRQASEFRSALFNVTGTSPSALTPMNATSARKRSRIGLFFEPQIDLIEGAGLRLEQALREGGWKVDRETKTDFGLAWAREFERLVTQLDFMIVCIPADGRGLEKVAYQLELARQNQTRRGGKPRLLALNFGASLPSRHFEIVLAAGRQFACHPPETVDKAIADILSEINSAEQTTSTELPNAS